MISIRSSLKIQFLLNFSGMETEFHVTQIMNVTWLRLPRKNAPNHIPTFGFQIKWLSVRITQFEPYLFEIIVIIK